MDYKKLFLYCNILLFQWNTLITGTESISNTMRFVFVKNINDKKNIIPFNRDFFNEMQRLFNADIFVETGTYRGDTTAVAATVFKQVHTIELGQELFEHSCLRFAQVPHISLYQGDSGEVLTKVLSKIQAEQKIVILLDSHWSGGDTAQGFDVPILREVDAIKKSGIKNSVILIDDIRCFQKQPSQSPDPCQYPELSYVIERIHEINPNYNCLIYGDILLAYTDHDIILPSIVHAMTISRLDLANDEMLCKAEAIIADTCEEDFSHLAHLANDLDISTGYWRAHYYDFWYALALYKRGNKTAAYQYMMQAAHSGCRRAQPYLNLWNTLF